MGLGCGEAFAGQKACVWRNPCSVLGLGASCLLPSVNHFFLQHCCFPHLVLKSCEPPVPVSASSWAGRQQPPARPCCFEAVQGTDTEAEGPPPGTRPCPGLARFSGIWHEAVGRALDWRREPRMLHGPAAQLPVPTPDSATALRNGTSGLNVTKGLLGFGVLREGLELSSLLPGPPSWSPPHPALLPDRVRGTGSYWLTQTRCNPFPGRARRPSSAEALGIFETPWSLALEPRVETTAPLREHI